MLKWDSTWETLWLVISVTLVNYNITSVQKTKKPYERERRKELVTLWLTNVADQVLPVKMPLVRALLKMNAKKCAFQLLFGV